MVTNTATAPPGPAPAVPPVPTDPFAGFNPANPPPLGGFGSAYGPNGMPYGPTGLLGTQDPNSIPFSGDPLNPVPFNPRSPPVATTGAGADPSGVPLPSAPTVSGGADYPQWMTPGRDTAGDNRFRKVKRSGVGFTPVR